MTSVSFSLICIYAVSGIRISFESVNVPFCFVVPPDVDCRGQSPDGFVCIQKLQRLIRFVNDSDGWRPHRFGRVIEEREPPLHNNGSHGRRPRETFVPSGSDGFWIHLWSREELRIAKVSAPD
jgi:hypothetical protein